MLHRAVTLRFLATPYDIGYERGHGFHFIPGNADNRRPLKTKNLGKRFWEKLYVDKGNISKELFQNLFANGIHLVTKFKNNVKSNLTMGAIVLGKRTIVGTIMGQFKNIFYIERSRNPIQARRIF